MIYPIPLPHRSNRRARAAAHRAMAIAALTSNSSLGVRYRRYHAHMRKAEALSRAADAIALEVVQEVSE
ncbi:hypothetical protein LWH48_17200 [Halomonas sp. G15]|uniref:hypothetical protein n=1 Tax=Halomonas sp. G15 TaxID=2903521 RepID=UPI001E58C6A1|nr:hypothetical protein [Halomonas sp. G15]MCE0734498.1 hypothetical protein [Halomonas sp. G15]